jgi:hypothetical protein
LEGFHLRIGVFCWSILLAFEKYCICRDCIPWRKSIYPKRDLRSNS